MDKAMANPAKKSPHPELPQAAVGAFVFKDDHILLIQRGHPPAQGQWAIPGGRIHLGETLKAAAEREIFEETGVSIRAGEPVYVFDSIQQDTSGNILFHYVIVDLAAEYVSGEPRAGDDAADARWVSRVEFPELMVNARTREALLSRFQFP
jgi:8-oxo-dGTP diphosphatase